MTQPIPLSNRKEEQMRKIVREFRVTEYEAFDCCDLEVLALLAVAEVVAEYVVRQEVA